LPDGCVDCHSTEYVEWDKLGWTDDPMNGGQRVDAPEASRIALPRARLD